MRKKVPVVTVAEPEEASRLAELPLDATVELTDLASSIRSGLFGLCADVGLVVMRQMMEAEITARIGPKHAKIPDRIGNWFGTTTGPVTLGGRRVSIERPRVRSKDAKEMELDTWAVFSQTDLLEQLVAERMLAGVATRRHADVCEPISEELDSRSKGTGRSSVSRHWKRATEKALQQLMARDLSDLDVAVVMIDGIEIAGQCCVAALLITTDAKKIPVGLWLGDTENKTVVTHLLADLVSRGLSAEGGLLLVIDGAKALAAGVKKVFGDNALVQRCTLHKRRNVAGHLPDDLAKTIDWRLARAFSNSDPDKGLETARRLARDLEADHPDAAASLREGLDEMFTVRRLGVGGRLAATLCCTNAIESMISIARTTMRNVKHWRDGQMKKRWVAAGLLEAERSFRRVKGCKDMGILVTALRRHAGVSDTAKEYADEAA